MKLYAMANALKTRLERVDHQNLTKEEFVSLPIDDEWLYRQNRKLVSRLKVAEFKERSAAIEDIDYRNCPPWPECAHVATVTYDYARNGTPVRR